MDHVVVTCMNNETSRVCSVLQRSENKLVVKLLKNGTAIVLLKDDNDYAYVNRELVFLSNGRNISSIPPHFKEAA